MTRSSRKPPPEDLKRAASRVLQSFASDSDLSLREESVLAMRDASSRSSFSAREDDAHGGAGREEGEENSDFECETPSADALDAEPSGPTAAHTALMSGVGSCTSAESVRRWVADASDSQLTTLVEGVREMHLSWLHADAARINLNVEVSLLRQGQLAAEVREVAERRASAGSTEQLTAALATSEQQREVLVAQLQRQQDEVKAMTLALQRAILEQKSVAEAKQPWRK
jgi:hypothetical protein